MSVDEIRMLANAPAVQFGGYYSPLEKHMIRAALLAYAAMVERCEEYRKVMQETGDNMYSKLIEEIIYNIQHGTKGATDERK